MLRSDFDIGSLAREADVVARVLAASDLFGLMSRSFVVPAGWVALATRRGRDAVVARAGDRYEHDETADVLFVRSTPTKCVGRATSLRSADGFDCSGMIRLSVCATATVGDLSAFRQRVIGSRDILSQAELAAHLALPMRDVLAEIASRLDAADLLRPMDASLVRSVVNEKLGAYCLAGGLTIDAKTEVCFESPTYAEQCRIEDNTARQRQHLADRTQIQQALETAQKQRLTHLVKMLEQIRNATRTRQDVQVADLLQAFNEADRGELYAALWHLCPGLTRTRWVAVVSGLEVLLFDPPTFSQPARRVRLGDELGLLRSVCMDPQSTRAGVLMVGAARGVHLIDVEPGRAQVLLPANIDPSTTVRGGVNAVAMSDDAVLATHSQLGLLSWKRKATGFADGQTLLPDITRGASSVRGAQVVDLQLWLTVDETLWSWPVSGGEPVRYRGERETLTALAVVAGRVYAGDKDGRILAWEIGKPASAQIVRGQGGGPVESIDVVRAGGVDHLLIADRASALTAIVAGDNCIRRYESGSQVIRRAQAAEDLFAAMNDSRDRLVVWNPQDPTRPLAVVIITPMTGSSIQDICLIPDPQP